MVTFLLPVYPVVLENRSLNGSSSNSIYLCRHLITYLLCRYLGAFVSITLSFDVYCAICHGSMGSSQTQS